MDRAGRRLAAYPALSAVRFYRHLQVAGYTPSPRLPGRALRADGHPRGSAGRLILSSLVTDRPGVSPEAGADPGVRRLTRIAFAVSGAAFGFLMYLLYLREPAAGAPAWTARIPGVNAGFNAATTTLVCLGVAAIRAGRRRVHIGLMILALVTTGLFLAGYITYHHYRGDTPYTGAFGPIYFPVLATHILASAAALPLLLTTVLLAASRRFPHHRRWARVTVPVWLYTSVTGLIVYAFLYG